MNPPLKQIIPIQFLEFATNEQTLEVPIVQRDKARAGRLPPGRKPQVLRNDGLSLTVASGVITRNNNTRDTRSNVLAIQASSGE